MAAAVPIVPPRVGAKVLAFYAKESTYFDAVVLSAERGQIKVRYTGYGNQATVPADKIRPIPPLPEHWSEAFDPTSGFSYFENGATGEVSWTRPVPEARRATVALPALPRAARAAAASPPSQIVGGFARRSNRDAMRVSRAGREVVGGFAARPARRRTAAAPARAADMTAAEIRAMVMDANVGMAGPGGGCGCGVSGC